MMEGQYSGATDFTPAQAAEVYVFILTQKVLGDELIPDFRSQAYIVLVRIFWLCLHSSRG